MTLLKLIENYLRKSGMTPSRFGRETLRDPGLIADLRCGRELRPRTEARIRAYIAASTGTPA